MIRLEPLPMNEAREFWADKLKLSAAEFAELSDRAKLRAFAVAGIAKGDELDTVFQALKRAIDEGISFDRFKAECGDIFERRGWTGRRSWRVDNIFRTNIQTAYNVGHYKQLQAAGTALPYWQYSAINDTRTRPTHLGMDGRVWPKDHPVWDTWFPPNGYRCRCSVIGLTASQVKARGLTVEADDPTGRLIMPVDPRSGNATVPRLLIPDPGFAQHPGKGYWGDLGQLLAERVRTWPRQLSLLAVEDLVGGEPFRLWLQDPDGAFPVGRIHGRDAVALEAPTTTVVLTAEAISGQARELAAEAADYVHLQQVLERGTLLEDQGRPLWLLEGEELVELVGIRRAGEQLELTTYRRLPLDEADQDEQVQRLRRAARDRR